MSTILHSIGEQLKRARSKRGLSQAELAARLGRDPARISELERDLRLGRMGRDRLTLLADICDALDLLPMLVPRSRSADVRAMIGEPRSNAGQRQAAPAAFDELFVDLHDEDEH
jgi:transcriptional regulator with XRE-family HTH domain